MQQRDPTKRPTSVSNLPEVVAADASATSWSRARSRGRSLLMLGPVVRWYAFPLPALGVSRLLRCSFQRGLRPRCRLIRRCCRCREILHCRFPRSICTNVTILPRASFKRISHPREMPNGNFDAPQVLRTVATGVDRAYPFELQRPPTDVEDKETVVDVNYFYCVTSLINQIFA